MEEKLRDARAITNWRGSWRSTGSGGDCSAPKDWGLRRHLILLTLHLKYTDSW